MAHEALHIVNFIMVDRNIKFDPHNVETPCYLVGWVVGEIHKLLKT